jgi:hypothetical protein
MSSRIAGLLVVSAATFIGGVSAIMGGCSEETAPGANSGTDAAPPVNLDASQRDAPPPGDAGPDPSIATCLAECAARYPGGKVKDDAITTCWKTKCAGRCTDLPADAGDAGGGEADAGDAGACQNPVDTEDPECDRCTQSHCCAEWDGCFNDDECTNFVQCSTACAE